MSEAEKLFTETFRTCNSRFAVISSFREITRLGFSSAIFHIYDQNLHFADALFNDQQYEKLFIDKQKVFESLGGVEAFGHKMTQDQLNNYKASVDAASLIFAHSIMDDAALNYCRCCALVNSNDWEKFVEKKQFSLEDIKKFSVDEMFSKKIHEYIDSLDRESLPLKADRLLNICKPPAGFSPLDNYVYDRDRLVELDKMRHEIVHKSSSVPMLPSGDKDIWFLQQTTNFFMALVNSKYELKINATHMITPQPIQ